MGCRQAVRHSTLTAAFVGSNPATPAKINTHHLMGVYFLLWNSIRQDENRGFGEAYYKTALGFVIREVSSNEFFSVTPAVFEKNHSAEYPATPAKKIRTTLVVLYFLSNPKDWYVIAIRRM